MYCLEFAGEAADEPVAALEAERAAASAVERVAPGVRQRRRAVDPEAAGARLETACTHLTEARRLAAQYRPGDAAALAERADSLRSMRHTLK